MQLVTWQIKNDHAMKIATFSTHHYDEQFLNEYNTGHDITFLKVPLNEQTALLQKDLMQFVFL